MLEVEACMEKRRRYGLGLSIIRCEKEELYPLSAVLQTSSII